MTENKRLQKILADLPKSPGIYKMIDLEGRVIYIGKAKDLSKRVKQYFKVGYEHSTRTRKLVENIDNIDFISVDSDLEAIILEHNLIKQLQPKYNVIMKDDKSYVYIKITREDFPRIQLVRKILKDNAKYIGPKTEAHKVKEILKFLKKLFPYRHCGLDIEYIKENPPDAKGEINHEVKVTNKVLKYPCLDFYIKRCIAPCIGKCGIEEYQKIVKNIENFLEGKGEDITNHLQKEMQLYAANRAYEKAAKTRDKIQKIQDILEKQKVQNLNQDDADVINYCISHNKAFFNLFQIRDSKLIGQENFILTANEFENDDTKEVLEAFLKQYYEMATDIPKEILVPHEIENTTEFETFFEALNNKKVKLNVPKIGSKNRLLEMSLNNARIYADRNKASWQEVSDTSISAAKELQTLLNLPKPLKRIECYDISHLSGTDTVASMVVFEDGVPQKKFYRKFHLRTVQNKPDDYKSMEEILTRRFSKIALETSQKDYKFRKATQKDAEFINNQRQKEGLKILEDDYKISYVLEKNKQIIAFAALEQPSDKVSKIRGIWVTESERGKKLGYKLLKNIVQKAKTKKVYLMCTKDLLDYYLIAGFELVNQIPEELKAEFEEAPKVFGTEIFCLGYYKTKHKDDESFKQIPDLVIIDGGKGQLGICHQVFQNLKIDIPHISLAKQLEEIFTPESNQSILLPRHNEALKLMQRARDEAHRFAISFNQNLRSKRMLKKT
ncbi:MAG: GNAT family N-acetyltransferase [Patescibacteria group bacterium]